MSSARLASNAKWLNARITGIAWWMSMPSNMWATSARSISERRTRNDATRARSTSANTSSPFCSRTVSPRIVPSSRMSSRIGSVASRPVRVRCTAPNGSSESGASAIPPSIRPVGRLRSACAQALYLIRSATPTMATSQMPTTNNVSRSRFFSTTVEPDRLDCTPPPNSVDRPPPLARCSSTSRTTRMLVTTRVICRANCMAHTLPAGGRRPQTGAALRRQRVRVEAQSVVAVVDENRLFQVGFDATVDRVSRHNRRPVIARVAEIACLVGVQRSTGTGGVVVNRNRGSRRHGTSGFKSRRDGSEHTTGIDIVGNLYRHSTVYRFVQSGSRGSVYRVNGRERVGRIDYEVGPVPVAPGYVDGYTVEAIRFQRALGRTRGVVPDTQDAG